MKRAFVCLIAFLTTYLVARSIGVFPTILFVAAGYLFHYVFSKRT